MTPSHPVRANEWMTAREALELATIGGAKVLGRSDIGSLEAGKCADFFSLDLDTIGYAGALHDPVAAVLFCAPQQARHTVVHGRPVVRDGECESLADVIGSLQDRALLERVFVHPDVLHEDVASAMQPPLVAVEASATLDDVFATLTAGGNAVVVAREGKPVGVLTRSDVLEFLAHSR